MDVGRIKRLLASLPELPLRIDWIRDSLLRWPADQAAQLLNALCEENERSDPAAREAMLPIALLFARLGDSDLVEELRVQAAEQRLLSLDRLLRRAPEPLHAVASELPIPDYGAGRELTVGERKSLARRPNRSSFEKLLGDPHPLVIRQLLKNPRLTEDDLIRLVTRRPARLEVMAELAQTCWLSRSRIRVAVLLNPGSPPAMTMPLLAVCTRGELRDVIQTSDAPLVLRATAHEFFERRPPLRDLELPEPTLQ
jgi:hypothetical protein